MSQIHETSFVSKSGKIKDGKRIGRGLHIVACRGSVSLLLFSFVCLILLARFCYSLCFPTKFYPPLFVQVHDGQIEGVGSVGSMSV